MKRFSCFFIWIFVLTSILPAQEREVKLKSYRPVIYETETTIPTTLYAAGSNRQSGTCACFGAKEREAYGKNLILLDNGDILQGQPTAYYYNYIDTVALIWQRR